MNDLFPTLLVLSSEAGVIIIVVFLLVMTIVIRRRRKERTMADMLVNNFKRRAAERQEQILQLLKENFAMDEAAVEHHMQTLCARQKSLYGRVLKIFSGEERDAIQHIDSDIQALTGAYHSLVALRQPEDTAEEKSKQPNGVESDPALQAEIDRLNQDNQRLKDDLKKALLTIDTIQTEYENLYNEHNGVG